MLVDLKSKDILLANKEMETLAAQIQGPVHFKDKISKFLLQKQVSDKKSLDNSILSGKSQMSSDV